MPSQGVITVTGIAKSHYTHLPLGKDVEAFAGYYTPENEVRMRHDGRDVLYVTGHIVIETTCGANGTCSADNYWYAIVPGYVLNWQSETNKEGLPVTEVELIRDVDVQRAIRDVILNSEAVTRVDFW